MKIMRKAISSVLLVCLLLGLFCPEVLAAGEGRDNSTAIVEPRNTNIKYTTLSLSLSGGTAYCSASVTGYSSNTSHVAIYLYLQEYNGGWTNVANWSGSASDYTLTVNKTARISRGRYRLKAIYQAQNEKITKYSSEKVY